MSTGAGESSADIAFESTLTADELRAVLFWKMTHVAAGTRWWLLGGACAMALAIFWLTLLLTHDVKYALISVAAALAFVLILQVSGTNIIAERRQRELAELGTFRYHFTEEGYSCTTDASSGSTTWAGLGGFAATNFGWLLFYRNGIDIPIMRRWLSPSQAQSLDALLARNLTRVRNARPTVDKGVFTTVAPDRHQCTRAGLDADGELAIELSLEPADYRETCRRIFSRASKNLIWLTAADYLLAVALFAYGFFAKSAPAVAGSSWPLTLALIFSIVLLYGYVQTTVVAPRRAYRSFAASGPVTVRISARGAGVDSAHGSGDGTWQQYRGYIDLPHHWMLVYPGSRFMPIPKRLIAPKAQPWLEGVLAENLRKLKTLRDSDPQASAGRVA